MENDPFYTVTMAKLYVEQDNLGKAAEIYRYLIKKDPGRQDLVGALSEVELQLAEKDPYGLVELFSEWADLMLNCARMKNLARVRRKVRR
jgi:hypothetical protein